MNGATARLIQTADGIIAKHGDKTDADVKLHQQHIEIMLKPVEETIKRLDKHIEDSSLSRTRAEALLDEQVKRLAGASESLTNALRKPVVKGTRLSVDFLLGLLAQGWAEPEILRNYPGLEREDLRACLAYAAEALSK